MTNAGRIGLKVCGMVDASNILEVGELNPEFMGFIFYPKSGRYVSRNFRIPAALPKEIQRVGVFVNQPLEEILHVSRGQALNCVQLHGSEAPDLCIDVKRNGFRVIKAFGIDEEFDFCQVIEYTPVVDYFLFDSKTDLFGGSGRRYNWKLLRKYYGKTPFFLSGGIGPEQVDEAMRLELPQLIGLDINSAVEVKPGLKDVGKVSQVIVRQRKYRNEIIER